MTLVKTVPLYGFKTPLSHLFFYLLDYKGSGFLAHLSLSVAIIKMKFTMLLCSWSQEALVCNSLEQGLGSQPEAGLGHSGESARS